MNNKSLHFPKTLALTFIMLACGASTASGQNLVPNSSFETYNSCPTDLNGGNGGTGYISIANSPGYSTFPTVKDWVNPCATTPDYFNSCATLASTVSTPSNWGGSQSPRTGNAYVGVMSYYGGSSEYVSAKLVSPLKKDSTYYISFFVSPAEFGINGSTNTETMVAVNEFGAHISSSLPNTTGYYLNLPFSMMNDTNRHLTDTTKWYEIAGNYKAEGGEQWITIGCFHGTRVPASSVIIQRAFGGTGYYYVDDVSVTPGKRNLAVNYAQSNSGLPDVQIFPNPAKDFIQINGLGNIRGDKTLEIIRVYGSVLKKYSSSGSELKLDISSLPQGVYVLRIHTADGSASYRILK